MLQHTTYKVSVVNYINSIPFVHGLRALSKTGLIHLAEDIPSVCADKLLAGQVDIGLVPIAVLPRLDRYFILPGYCIGADGPVNSVMLFSKVPLEEIKTILLDYQSRTSVMLLKLLAADFWHINPLFKMAEPGYEEQIGDNTAALVIGDRSFKHLGKHPFTFDLANEWKKHTGLPFVFACWASREQVSEEFIQQFNAALEQGLNAREDLCLAFPDPAFIKTYLMKHISYPLTDEKRKAMLLFLERIPTLQ